MIAVGLMTFIVLGILGAFVAYARTSYKQGGWKRVRRDLLIAAFALAALALERIAQNSFFDSFKHK